MKSLSEQLLDLRLNARSLTCRVPRPRRLHPLLGMICGLMVGFSAIAAWIATFEPHGGPENCLYLFPVWSVIAGWVFQGRSVPAVAWYGGAVMQWVLIGASFDLFRMIRLRRTADR